MDALSDVFRTLSVRSTIYFRTALTAPWGLEVPSRERVARFHVVIDGTCMIEVAGQRPVSLQRGDLALVPHGLGHVLRSDRDAAVVPLDRVLDEAAYDGTDDLRYGGGGARSTLVCGHFSFDDEIPHPALETLPSMLHVSAAAGHDFTWLDGAARTLGRETAVRPPGWEVVVDRAAEILLVQALRACFAETGDRTATAAFLDERLSRALAAIHQRPGHVWSLEELARRAGMSRTAFAVRFRELMGMPPMAYVTRWRLQKARAALLESDDIVARIAERCGYASEAAFSRAFQRLYGHPPASYRRQMQRAPA